MVSVVLTRLLEPSLDTITPVTLREVPAFTSLHFTSPVTRQLIFWVLTYLPHHNLIFKPHARRALRAITLAQHVPAVWILPSLDILPNRLFRQVSR